MDSAGSVYVADFNNHRIQKFDSRGNFITKWGSQGDGDGQFDSPSEVAVDNAGSVYVTDGFNHRIQKFDALGNFKTKWGSQGNGNSQFQTPRGVAVDSAGSVYVAEGLNHRIQKFGLVQPGVDHALAEAAVLESKLDALQAEVSALRQLDLAPFQSPALLIPGVNVIGIGASLGGLPVDVTLAGVQGFKITAGEPREWVDLGGTTVWTTPLQGHLRTVVISPLVPISQFRVFLFIVEHDTGDGIVSGTAWVPNEHFDTPQLLQ